VGGSSQPWNIPVRWFHRWYELEKTTW
jgi:hypothetical protein